MIPGTDVKNDESMIPLLGVRRGPPFERYLFDAATGHYERSLHDDWNTAVARANGWCDVRCIGLRKQEEVFAAIYSHGQQMHAVIPPQHFIWPGPFLARRSSSWLGVKSLRISAAARTHPRFRYRFNDAKHGFPGPEAADIFFKIAWETSSAQRIWTFIYFWEENAAGGDVATKQFQQRLASRVREKVTGG